MRILYAIQGTGNGHVSRAREIIPHLKQYGSVDLLLSGSQAEVTLDDPVKFRLSGLGFVFGKKGGVDFLKTMKTADLWSFLKDIRSLPVQDYDLIIHDFEPVTAWACKLRGKKSVGLSHQSAFLSEKTPQLKGFHWGKFILKHYAPASRYIAFHFKRYDDFIHTPVIRSEIRSLTPADDGHYTVYLPAYSDEFILKQIKNIPVHWQIFSKHSKDSYQKDNAEVFPVNNKLFQQSLQNCTGLLTGGGFEGPAEALFLGKKVMVVPMHHQYEQQCNALAMGKMGIPVIWSEEEFPDKLRRWAEHGSVPVVDFPDETRDIIAELIRAEGGCSF